LTVEQAEGSPGHHAAAVLSNVRDVTSRSALSRSRVRRRKASGRSATWRRLKVLRLRRHGDAAHRPSCGHRFRSAADDEARDACLPCRLVKTRRLLGERTQGDRPESRRAHRQRPRPCSALGDLALEPGLVLEEQRELVAGAKRPAWLPARPSECRAPNRPATLPAGCECAGPSSAQPDRAGRSPASSPGRASPAARRGGPHALGTARRPARSVEEASPDPACSRR
jgi:hypothetical protein